MAGGFDHGRDRDDRIDEGRMQGGGGGADVSGGGKPAPEPMAAVAD